MAEATLNEYEMLYILHPRLTEDGIQQSVERVSGLITSNGGEVLTVDNWGRRRLAYPINHELDGTYVLTTFKSPPTGTQPVEQQMQIAEDVLRHLLIRGIIPYEGPPEQIRERERERPPRPEGDAAPAGDAPAAEGDEPSSEAPAAEATAGDAPAADTSPEAEAEATDDAPEAASEGAPAAEAAPEAEAAAGGDEPAPEETAEAPSEDAPEVDATPNGEETPPTDGSG